MPLFDFVYLAAVQSLSLYLILALVRLSQTLEPLIWAQSQSSNEKEPLWGLLLERLVTQV